MNRKIILNQIGYISNQKKTAVYAGSADSFQIVNAKNGKAMFSGLLKNPVYDKASGDTVSLIDFSTFNVCGKYYVRIGLKKSLPFVIADNPYSEVKKGLLKGIYYNRCSSLDKKFAGDYAHKACHSDLVPLFENPSKRIDVSGGWHDSGGYGKFSVCTSVTLGHLLYAYTLFPESFAEKTDIPESGNGIPDILNECRVGLEWLMKMQARDGGIYHKVVWQTPPEPVMPEDDPSEHYVFAKSHQASACGCAVLALASRVFADFDSAFAARLNEASINAWIWLMNNPNYQPFETPPTIALNAAGDFHDDNFNDELFWAVCELYEMTGDSLFHDKIKELCGIVDGTGFVNREVSGFGTMAYLFGRQPIDKNIEQTLHLRIRIKADNLYGLSRKSGYGTAKSVDDYVRGSNMYSMTDSMALILAYIIFGCEEYIATICEQMNYILGKNPVGVCYITGFGRVSVMHPHHRQSEADDIEEPVPGLLVCGPSKLVQDNFTQWNIPEESAPAKCYYDVVHSYTTNEPTIYTNSAAVFVTGYLDSLQNMG
ncbi:MAG: glycoside hydrolase family 9 protein [Oscillospiraceae bacterium]|nr:glycoside hydrolase family 9 protein [Oscillospiraceae bacterium]